jgi:hypothetical protein
LARSMAIIELVFLQIEPYQSLAKMRIEAFIQELGGGR